MIINKIRHSISLFLLIVIVFSGCKSSKQSYSSSSGKSGKNKYDEDKVVYINNDAEKVVKEARTYLGTKYKYGGDTKRGMDCSGLICKSYHSVGVELPRRSVDQSNVGKRVYIGELQEGDLIFFGARKGSNKITHVGLVTYSVDGVVRFIHSSSSAGVIESDLSNSYWRPRYIKAVRPTEE